VRSRPTALAATGLALALAGCGGGASDRSASSSTATTARSTPAPRPAAPERNEPPAQLPNGWQLVVDKPGGFSFGVPRGWRAHRVQSGELVRSADKALAISVSYDRSAAARTLDLRTYASRVAHALQGYRDLHVAAAHRIPGQRHPTVTVQARGVFRKTHVRQSILVIAVRRPQRGTFSVLAFRSAKTRAVRYAPEITELVNTLRTRK
jgi:hypothetical protein